ncbi:hypothetical protein GJ496_009057 [Pomphorhynchus laevis]|nr:hypothetical protein GJ496_009057 [Pomphorhynchus laevis]
MLNSSLIGILEVLLSNQIKSRIECLIVFILTLFVELCISDKRISRFYKSCMYACFSIIISVHSFCWPAFLIGTLAMFRSCWEDKKVVNVSSLNQPPEDLELSLPCRPPPRATASIEEKLCFLKDIPSK